MCTAQKYDDWATFALISEPTAHCNFSSKTDLLPIDGLSFLTADERRQAATVRLPTDFGSGMAPTLQPGDLLLLTPLSLITDPIGAIVLLQLREHPRPYLVGRLTEQNECEWVLADNDPAASENWVGPDQIESAWIVRLIVDRKIS